MVAVMVTTMVIVMVTAMGVLMAAAMLLQLLTAALQAKSEVGPLGLEGLEMPQGLVVLCTRRP